MVESNVFCQPYDAPRALLFLSSNSRVYTPSMENTMRTQWDELTRRLLTEQNECTLGWLAQDGRPVATIVSFVLLDSQIALTALDHSSRVRAIRRDPRVAVTVSGVGSPLGHSRCVSIQGRCEIRTDQTTRDRFFPAFSRAVLRHSERGARMMEQAMNTPDNLVLLVSPEKIIPYDAHENLERADRM